LKTNFNDIDELLAKMLTGEASADEKNQVQQWLGASEENRRYYDHFRLIWEESLQLAATTTVDENAAWQRFQQRTKETPAPRAAKTIHINRIRIAAAVIITIGLGWMGWFLINEGNKEVPLALLQTTDSVKSETLPDGSFITINKNSSLSYPEQFAGNSRRVQLTGEGFFKVQPDKKKPFIVSTGNNVTIEVLGTSFNVKNRGDSVEVIVEEGRVMVKYQDQSVELKKGEVVVIKKSQPIAEKRIVTDNLHNYYYSHAFVCEDVPLWKLVNALNEAYNAKIRIERGDLRETRVTAKIDMNSLDTVLEVLSQAVNFEIVKTDSTINLR